MAATNSPSPTQHGQSWRTAGMTVGLLVLGAACLIPLGVSFVFWAPFAFAIAIGMLIVSGKRRATLREEGRDANGRKVDDLSPMIRRDHPTPHKPS